MDFLLEICIYILTFLKPELVSISETFFFAVIINNALVAAGQPVLGDKAAHGLAQLLPGGGVDGGAQVEHGEGGVHAQRGEHEVAVLVLLRHVQVDRLRELCYRAC